jgi:hypothetical protein
MWLYVGLTNPTRELANELTDAEVDAQIKIILGVGAMVLTELAFL